MSSHPLTFIGHISNRAQLLEQLQLSEDASINQIIYSAYNRWSVTFNQHVSGDYALILPLENLQQVFICLSVFSSHQLFYRVQQEQLQLATHAQAFRQQAKVQILSVACLVEHGVIAPPWSLFDGVSQLSSGESQLWCTTEQSRLLSKHTLTLWQKLQVKGAVNTPEATPVCDAPGDFDFNKLPQLTRQLCQPVNQPWLVTFAAQIANTPEKNLKSDAGPEHLGTVNLPNIVNKILAPIRRRCGKKIVQIQQQWQANYQEEMAKWPTDQTKPDFDHWFALTYSLPAKWSQMRIIAQSADKTISFIFCDPTMAASLLYQRPQNEEYQPLFGFDSPSIKNLYDAFGRLMWHGNTEVTQQLFKLVPPFTAGLINKHSKHPEPVDSICCHSLTLDHLSRQYHWSLTD